MKIRQQWPNYPRGYVTVRNPLLKDRPTAIIMNIHSHLQYPGMYVEQYWSIFFRAQYFLFMQTEESGIEKAKL